MMDITIGNWIVGSLFALVFLIIFYRRGLSRWRELEKMEQERREWETGPEGQWVAKQQQQLLDAISEYEEEIRTVYACPKSKLGPELGKETATSAIKIPSMEDPDATI